MRYFIASLTFMLSVWCTGTALAADEGEQSAEKTTAETEQADVVEQSDVEKKPARGSGKRGSKGRRGDRDRRGPPDPGKIFDKFDENGDGQLSREEFMELSKSMRQHHARHRQGEGQRGDRPERGFGPREGDRPGPPPPEGQRGFRPPRPLQNPGDRPGPPPEGRRGRPGAEGQRGGPPGRGRMPDPAEVFNRFDANGDDQLSRSEFMELAETMREMRQQRGQQQGRRGGKGSRGSRQGPPRRGGPEGFDRPRPPRGERDGANFAPPVLEDSTA